MKRLTLLLGVVLFVTGIVFLIHPTFDYHKRDEIAKIGPITATVEKQESAKVPAPVTVTLLIVGAALLVIGARSKS